MIIDLFHNKIIKDTATDAFVDSFNTVLVPMLQYKYGDSIEAITMYEDYLADEFLADGCWHYPLSVKLEGEEAIICWIKWPVTKRTFRNNVPYTYVGNDTVAFSFAEEVPAEFKDKLQGRAIDYDRSALRLTVEAVTDDPLLLVGKYSQTFVDELARQITADIAKTVGVEGLENTTMELQLIFAPGTYLEHTSEKVTYRRLLLVDKGCQARDFWVKWARTDGAGAARVSDHNAANFVKFEIGEDAPHKIREKEYRFLATANPHKYQSAMGKKTVTEWRDIIKRAIKHGLLVKVATEREVADHAAALFDAFSAVYKAKEEKPEAHIPVVESVPVSHDRFDVVAALSEQMNSPIPMIETVTTAEDDTIADLVRATLGLAKPTEPTPVVEEEPVAVFEAPVFEEIPEEVDKTEDDILEIETEAIEADEQLIFEPVFAPIITLVETDEPEVEDFFGLASAGEETEKETFTMGEVTIEEYERTVAETKQAAPAPEIDVEAIRKKIEAELRLELEAKARQEAEAEALKLRQEREKLREENERLMRIAKEAEERRIAEEAARKKEEEERRLAEEAKQRALAAERAEAERQRLEQEARRRLEEQERARMAETARLAVEEQKRIEAERQARAERERQQAVAKEAERLRQEEEARRAEEQRRLEEQRRREEEERKEREAALARTISVMVTKKANLIFRYTFDVNIAKKIKELLQETIQREGKNDVDIHIKAYPGESPNVFVLEITLPESENSLLVSMMQTIGKSGIGVMKIVIE